MTLFGATIAATHEIGDVAGWTAAGTVDYTNCASTNNFQVGDRLDFKYNQQFHNVMEVSRQEFESCNSSSPIITYTTGDDTVELSSAGHRYFLCSTPGHCDAGQKLDIFVHCHEDDGAASSDLSPLDHRGNLSPFINTTNPFIQLVLWFNVWHMFVQSCFALLF
ncbi:Cupredoxin superfamily protein [Perilla frutescens var. frutescens]|nr:Cupredoxin superfamily protein [Perilla frutescens var. frutescens]